MKSKILLGWFTALVAVVFLMPAPAVAQAPGKWWQSDHFRRELGLTTEQSRRLEEIFQTAAPSLRAQKKSLDAAEMQFERLVEKGDDGSVMDQVDSVEAARAELNKSRTMMLLRMRRVLTTDQWVKFTALQHQAAQKTAGRERAK